MSDLRWQYGVTTVPQRFGWMLQSTLLSLARGGFDEPRLFVDGPGEAPVVLPSVNRDPSVGTVGNWILSMWELYLRDPVADRYAIFQDDLVCCRNLKSYLNGYKYPSMGYLNLLTFASNENFIKGKRGWVESDQMGKGAVGLVFDNAAVKVLLRSHHLVEKAQTKNGHKNLDGAIVTAMKQAGYKEYVHSPSLVQHVGEETTMGNMKHPKAETFPGETFDALTLRSE